MFTDTRWQVDAVCRAYDPELFFPIGTTGPAQVTTTVAKLICAGCPVRRQCLVWSINTGQRYGIFGGLTEDERRLLVRRRKAARQRAQRRSESPAETAISV